MSERNEAAERLRHALEPAKDHIWLMEQALAAERRATVERIREAMYAKFGPGFYALPGEREDAGALVAILDEEAAR